jgi:hypothetical protein
MRADDEDGRRRSSESLGDFLSPTLAWLDPAVVPELTILGSTRR